MPPSPTKPSSLRPVILEYLKSHPGKRFSAREIVSWLLREHEDLCRAKQERSAAKKNPLDNDPALMNQIAAEIPSLTGVYTKDSIIKRTEDSPRKYYFTEDSEEIELEKAEVDLTDGGSSSGRKYSSQGEKSKEKDLYLPLSQFLYDELGLHAKRINESVSSNKQGRRGNQWLHPDLVAMEDLSQHWTDSIKKLNHQYNDNRTKLWSFEVKILLNRTNLRESFFQAVSNSSWANFGYLVASEIAGVNVLREFRILSGRHGIGLIHLKKDEVAESQILIPAHERQGVDWDTMNRLAEANKDFRSYIDSVTTFYQTEGKTIVASDWTNVNK